MTFKLTYAATVALMIALSPPALSLPIVPVVLGQRAERCSQYINTSSRISRANLKWLLNYRIGEPSPAVLLRLGGAYCFLRLEGDVELYAFPMASDPSTWIIVKLHHRQDTYQGYDISYGNRELGGGL